MATMFVWLTWAISTEIKMSKIKMLLILKYFPSINKIHFDSKLLEFLFIEKQQDPCGSI